MLEIYAISIVFMLIGWIINTRLKNKMEKYSRMPNSSGMTGAQIATKMLHDHGIHDVQVTGVNGFLTDHYHPTKKTINLSPAVYQTASVAAAAVAAHEVGHAVQHAKGYTFLKLRSALVPVAKIGGGFAQMLLIGGLVLLFGLGMEFLGEWVLMAGIIAFGTTTLFSIITLPVEVDATKRGIAWIEQSGIVRGVEEISAAKDGLRWAAYTYFLAALQSIVTLLYYIALLYGRR